MNDDDIHFLVYCLGLAAAKFLEDRQLVLDDSTTRDVVKQQLAKVLTEHAERAERLAKELKASANRRT
jgi:hypothetical protein